MMDDTEPVVSEIALKIQGSQGSERLTELIRSASIEGASDLHLRAGQPPRVRVDGQLYPLGGEPVTHDILEAFLYGMLDTTMTDRFERTRELDFSFSLAGVTRMRFNLYIQQGVLSASIRLIPERIPTMEEIYLPQICYQFVDLASGLILVTGPTGCGKSTTLAAMLDNINSQRRCHILTFEDPVEYIYVEKMAMISQREMGVDTSGYHAALRHAFRQDPDVILIGEMRDLETMQAAITLAETGHLTFSTLHTSDAAQTLHRVIDSFSPHQQSQVRAQLAVSLHGIISQKLVPLKDHRGRVAAREILVCTRAVRNHLREGKVPMIFSDIQTGQEEGMITMNYSLGELYRRGLITYEVALQNSTDRAEFAKKYSI